MNNYHHSGICYFIDKSDEIKNKYYDLCFKKTDHNLFEYCVPCLLQFYDDNNDKIHNEIVNDNDNAMAFYCCFIEHDDNCRRILSRAIDKGNECAIILLGLSYCDGDSDNDEMLIKYLKLAISKGNKYAMCEMAKYYNNKIDMICMINNVNDIIDHASDMTTMFYNDGETKRYLLMAIYDLCYEDVTDDHLKNIYNLDVDRISKNNSGIALYELGNYHKFRSDDANMIKCYELAGQMNNVNALFELGQYYSNYEDKHEIAKQYYLKAIEKNNTDSMFALGNHYNLTKNYELMKKYYLMAAQRNHCGSIYQLGFYYQEIELNYDLMIKYYAMMIDINQIIHLYAHLCKATDHIIKLYLMVNNKNLLFKYADKNDQKKILDIIDKCQSHICDLCFAETICYPKNDKYVCNECY